MPDISDEDDFAPLDQQEDLGDFGEGGWQHGAALWSTDWTTETLIRQLEKGNIDLNPRWQRRGAWADDRQSRFVESLFLGLPVPQLILAENPRKRGTYIVIDGKQRLLSLARFAAAEGGELGTLRLRSLTDLKELNKKTYRQIAEDFSLQDLVNQFDNYTIRTVVIKSWTDDRYLYSVFLRINTGSTPLSPQELRQALSPGEFSNFIDDFSADSTPLRKMMGLSKPDFRMRDAEILLRFIAYRMFYRDYRGVLKSFLDYVTKQLNDNWDSANADIVYFAQQMNESILFTESVFGRDYMRKWNGHVFERRINRAVFDIMSYYFSIPDIRQSIINSGSEKEVVSRFIQLCDDDEYFRRSLESTTKSMEANEIRFNLWARVLSDVTGLTIEAPQFA